VRPALLVRIVAFLALGVCPALAGEKVWVGLYLAKNTPPPPGAVLAPEKLARRLHLVFGFDYYQFVKAEEIELGHEWDQWAVPRRDFFIRLQPLRHLPDQPRLVEYEIFKDGFSVANGRFQPQPDRPLFISGPDLDRGRLIFVLESR